MRNMGRTYRRAFVVGSQARIVTYLQLFQYNAMYLQWFVGSCRL